MKILSRWRGKKTNPIQTQSNPLWSAVGGLQMNINSIITKDYRKKDDFEVRINKPNLRNAQNERKLIYSKGLQKKSDFAAQKNKPNSNPISELQFSQRFFRTQTRRAQC